MAKKRVVRKPPVTKDKIRQRLERAVEQDALVCLRRWIPKAARVEGFVVGLSDTWVLLAQLS